MSSKQKIIGPKAMRMYIMSAICAQYRLCEYQ